ncbi:MAG: histidine phosphatase family protein [Bacteroidota bacterium]|nr:MAG: histidine phosphatase family protein [Bacteroidota bacterium]
MSTNRLLYIVRHAKSSWDLEGIADIDRPLKLKGIRDAYEIARRIKIDRAVPERIVSSPANRALHTALIFLRVFEMKFTQLVIDERLYATGVGAIRKVISDQPIEVRNLMIFGHNPDFSDLVTILSGQPIEELPTCGMCRIKFKADNWNNISAEKLMETSFEFPRKEVNNEK